MTETINISLPENIADITLDQYVRFEELRAKESSMTPQRMVERVVSLFTGIKNKDIKKLAYKDFEDIANQITQALDKDAKFEQRFFLNGVEYGLIPNLDEITTAEYVDLSSLGLDFKNMHKVMGVLFRRITEEDPFGNYKIQPYRYDKKHCDEMKQCPMHVVNGALVFFWNLSRELKEAILKSTRQAEERNKQ